MEVEAACSSSKHYPQEIDQLLEAFGSAFSIEYIASTYLQANRNIEMAGELLCELRATAASTASHQPKDDTDISPKTYTVSRNSSAFDIRPCLAQGDSKVLDFGEGPVLTENAHKDMGDFLFKMLGDGFQLDMEVIHGVLSSCGYNMEKSVETLLKKTASTLGERDDILSKAAKIPRNNEKMADLSCQGKSQHRNSVRSSKKRNKGKNDLEKELLQSLFTISNIPEKEPKKSRPCKPISSFGRFGRVVTVPLEDTPIEQKTLYVTPLHPSKDEDEDEDSFDVLSQAVKEHWATMKDYYKAAGEAFLKGDCARADKLMAKGHFFSKKAREVDNLSLQKIVEPEEEQEELLLDLSDLQPKESVQHLRSQLVNFCGISGIPYLKVKVGNSEGRAKEEASRKRMILKLLENESIKWSEMEAEKIISIRVDEINPKSFSFYKK